MVARKFRESLVHTIRDVRYNDGASIFGTLANVSQKFLFSSFDARVSLKDFRQLGDFVEGTIQELRHDLRKEAVFSKVLDDRQELRSRR